jgi:hypothetical protein
METVAVVLMVLGLIGRQEARRRAELVAANMSLDLVEDSRRA